MTTGRPRDEFAWRHVNRSIDGKLECKFCGKVFAGTSSRIRNHLSGKGKDINECPSVPMEIKEEALNRRDTALKRRHKNSSVQDPSASTSNTHVSFTKKATDEHVTDAFMKFLMFINCSSSAVTDFMENPHLREFLERASEYGVPSGLLAVDSEVVRKSVFNIKEEVYRNTLMLKESWKTTGCTLMVFKGIFPSHDHKMCMFGFYCPKGIVFVEAPDPDINFEDFENALERHKPSLDLDYAITYGNVILRHNSYYSQGSDDWTTDFACEYWDTNVEFRRCLRDEVEEICIDVCRESEWAESLVNRAVEIHEKICCHGFLRQGYYEILKSDITSFNDFDNIKGLPAFRLSVILSLMRRRQELSEYIKRMSLGENVVESLEAIFHDLNDHRCKFYVEGRKLELVLTYTLEFSDCMDTLVPTSGYLATAIEKLEDRVRRGSRYQVVTEGEDSCTFWKELKSRLTGIIQGSRSMEAASYMNPHYFLQEDVQKDPQLPPKVNNALTKALNLYEDEYDSADEDDELLKEVQCYGDVFSRKLSANNTLRDYHPAKLWEEHGHELPYLQKHAIVLLSQPLNCMCKQLKKHMYQLQGAEDYILRLNVRMMQEFKLLGDDIYKPPDFSLLKGFMKG